MVKEGTLPFKFDKKRVARFGMLPRYARDASEIRWFETEGVMCFHVVSHAGCSTTWYGPLTAILVAWGCC